MDISVLRKRLAIVFGFEGDEMADWLLDLILNGDGEGIDELTARVEALETQVADNETAIADHEGRIATLEAAT